MQQPRDAAVSEVRPGLWSSTTRHLVSRPLRSIAAAPCRLPRGARGRRMRSVSSSPHCLPSFGQPRRHGRAIAIDPPQEIEQCRADLRTAIGGEVRPHQGLVIAQCRQARAWDRGRRLGDALAADSTVAATTSSRGARSTTRRGSSATGQSRLNDATWSAGSRVTIWARPIAS